MMEASGNQVATGNGPRFVNWRSHMALPETTSKLGVFEEVLSCNSESANRASHVRKPLLLDLLSEDLPRWLWI